MSDLRRELDDWLLAQLLDRLADYGDDELRELAGRGDVISGAAQILLDERERALEASR